jgi:hypothetical protein
VAHQDVVTKQVVDVERGTVSMNWHGSVGLKIVATLVLRVCGVSRALRAEGKGFGILESFSSSSFWSLCLHCSISLSNSLQYLIVRQEKG